MEITIPVSEEERADTLGAILKLNDVPHLKSMSQAMIAETANIKATKIRVILTDLIKRELITQYQVSQNKFVQRYYYVLTDAGRELLQEEN